MSICATVLVGGLFEVVHQVQIRLQTVSRYTVRGQSPLLRSVNGAPRGTPQFSINSDWLATDVVDDLCERGRLIARRSDVFGLTSVRRVCHCFSQPRLREPKPNPLPCAYLYITVRIAPFLWATRNAPKKQSVVETPCLYVI